MYFCERDKKVTPPGGGVIKVYSNDTPILTHTPHCEMPPRFLQQHVFSPQVLQHVRPLLVLATGMVVFAQVHEVGEHDPQDELQQLS